MAALGAHFVGNHRLLSEEDRFLNHRVMRISRSARPAAISCCTDSGGGKMSIKALAKLESISKATLPACIEGEERRALAMKTMEHWMRESVVEIVQNLRGSSSLLAEVYTEGRGGEFTLKIGKAGAEDWPEIKEKWKKGETSSPDGIIVVEELKDEGEEDTKVKKEERFWGLMVQGKPTKDFHQIFNPFSVFLPTHEPDFLGFAFQMSSENMEGSSSVNPRSDSKVMREKRSGEELGERSEMARKRVKMRDLDSVLRSEDIDTNYTKSSKTKGANGQEMSQVTEVPVTMASDAAHEATKIRDMLPPQRQLDLNAKVCSARKLACDVTSACVEEALDWILIQKMFVAQFNQDPFYSYKKRDRVKSPDGVSECASSTGPLEEKDPMKVWKEMKQNGFLSSTHGGIPVPKQRARKNKQDVIKKKIELAKREQVDRFTKIAAPSGLLNELNPGIINHVRNSKQVHSIIEALVRSEQLENGHAGSKQASHSKSGTKEISDEKKDPENVNVLGKTPLYPSHEDGPTKIIPLNPSNNMPANLQIRGNPMLVNKSMSLSSEDKGGDAATVASQWLELLHQDIKGRLAALRRSKKRVRAVIHTELPFLISKEFPSNQENNSSVSKDSAAECSNIAVAEMHQARWSALFDQMDKSLFEEEKQLESWLNQVKEMQMHCERGLQHFQWNLPHWQHPGTIINDPRILLLATELNSSKVSYSFMVSCHTDHRWWTTQRGNWLLGQLQLPFTQPATFYCQWKMYLASDLVNSC
uniref:DUF7804 domain-containing protein n=1 Tax=Vitis vinifera TaxID=29760 RepID=A5BR42_VITVI|nr:hypothetical protein VITISV_024205 [Vitis vinifera]